MAIDVSGIHEGMEVFAVDGEMIGRVVRLQTPRADDEDSGDWLGSAAGEPDVTQSEGQIIAGTAGLGPAPSGTLSGAPQRGSATTVGQAAARGDITRRDEQRDAEPGAGGMDVTRGYGTPEAGTGEIGRGGPPATGTPVDALRGFDDDQSETGVLGDGEERRRARLQGTYVLVQDAGVLGVGAGGLRIPAADLLDVMPGRRVTLGCTRTEARERYGSGPSLDIDENARETPF